MTLVEDTWGDLANTVASRITLLICPICYSTLVFKIFTYKRKIWCKIQFKEVPFSLFPLTSPFIQLVLLKSFIDKRKIWCKTQIKISKLPFSLVPVVHHCFAEKLKQRKLKQNSTKVKKSLLLPLPFLLSFYPISFAEKISHMKEKSSAKLKLKFLS